MALERGVVVQHIHQHFSNVAEQYNDIRTTDREPVALIRRVLSEDRQVTALDVGCGPGRYDLALLEALGSKLHLICLDANASMLQKAASLLEEKWADQVSFVKGSADDLPCADASIDCILSFNAIHHFPLNRFFQEVGRVLKKNGWAFIYTRTRTQNQRSIWGRHFPDFAAKESRLFEIEELEERLIKVPQLDLLSVDAFKFLRSASLKQLVEQAELKHYSTFCLYPQGQFQSALQQFRENVRATYANEHQISWSDENMMLVLRRR